ERSEARADRIITATTPPERISDNPDDWRCRFCPALILCHGADDRTAVAVPIKTLSCRQCIHATPETDTDYGRWSCAYYGKSLSDEQHDDACPHHLLIY